MTDLLHQSIGRIGPCKTDALAAAEDRHGQLTKPPGSPGVLESVGIQPAGINVLCRQAGITAP